MWKRTWNEMVGKTRKIKRKGWCWLLEPKSSDSGFGTWKCTTTAQKFESTTFFLVDQPNANYGEAKVRVNIFYCFNTLILNLVTLEKVFMVVLKCCADYTSTRRVCCFHILSVSLSCMITRWGGDGLQRAYKKFILVFCCKTNNHRLVRRIRNSIVHLNDGRIEILLTFQSFLMQTVLRKLRSSRKCKPILFHIV